MALIRNCGEITALDDLSIVSTQKVVNDTRKIPPVL